MGGNFLSVYREKGRLMMFPSLKIIAIIITVTNPYEHILCGKH